jgi:hypothetical protein
MRCWLLCAVLFLSFPVTGQNPSQEGGLPDSASATKFTSDGSETAFSVQPIHFAPPPLSLEPGPPRESKRVADRNFWLTALFQVGATIGDIESTQYGLSHGARELNPLYGSHPSRAKQYAITMPIAAAVLGWSYRLKRSAPHSKYWLIPPLVVGSMHTIAACHNLVVIKTQ